MEIEIKLPELGENVDSGDIVNLLVREGDRIAANDGVVELETDKAVVEIPCPQGGRIAKIHVRKGDAVKVGQVLLTVEAEAEPAEAADAAAGGAAKTSDSSAGTEDAADAEPVKVEPAPSAEGPIPAGPAARRLARELGVDLRGIQGSGQRGRITPEDVRAAASPSQAPSPAAASPPVVPPGEPGEDKWGPVRRERLSKIRQTIAAQMVKSATTIPQVTNFDDADVTDLERLRKGVPPGYLGEGIKLTLMPLVIKAVALALQRHPVLNASLDEDSQQVVYKQYVNLGVAVDTPRGLVVPVIRGVNRMPIPEIARQLQSIAQKARAAEFAVDDLRGGTFTISNLGAVGGSYSTPLVNPPEVAVLLSGRSRWMPAVREGKIEPRLTLPLSLSYDHRLVDGAAAGRFLNEVIDYLQTPGKLLLA